MVQSFQAHSFQINRIKQSPFSNLKYVATCSDDATVKIWNVLSSPNWTLITTYSQHLSNVRAMEWLDNDTLASAGFSDKIIKIWSLSSGQTKREIQTNQRVLSLKLLNTNIHLAAGLADLGDINIYNINDGNLVSSLQGHSDWVKDLVQISDDLLASSSDDKTVRLWNLTTNTCKFIITGHTSYVNVLKQITTSILASGGVGGYIKLYDTSNGREIRRNFDGHTGSIWWSLDIIDNGGQTLVSGGGIDQTIRKWNWTTGELLSTIETGSSIQSLAVIYLGEYLFSSLFHTNEQSFSKKGCLHYNP